jgi:hypothetical protein
MIYFLVFVAADRRIAKVGRGACRMNTWILGGLSAALIAIALAGCSSSSSSSTTTTTTSTTLPAAGVSGASSPRALGVVYAGALKNGAKFCTAYALPAQVSDCTADLSQAKGASLKGFKVGAVAVQGTQAVITFTGTACSGDNVCRTLIRMLRRIRNLPCTVVPLLPISSQRRMTQTARTTLHS